MRRAHDLRIEAVHQEKSLADKQPLWRNLFVGRQITNRFGFIDVKRQKAIANQLLREQIGFRGCRHRCRIRPWATSPAASARGSRSGARCISMPT